MHAQKENIKICILKLKNPKKINSDLLNARKFEQRKTATSYHNKKIIK